jgi:hypothetical protein
MFPPAYKKMKREVAGEQMRGWLSKVCFTVYVYCKAQPAVQLRKSGCRLSIFAKLIEAGPSPSPGVTERQSQTAFGKTFMTSLSLSKERHTVRHPEDPSACTHD